ncbi:histidine kinase [Actinoplanes sp. NEAU-A12]|uniref:histidine kinase n=1 Tax=Actinoplanes sandaracinus TaxID=3045177 RepID=A0ABT6WPT3_9ACTN|nr:histidine kinase [Actinoplanes sandaracinus]MDI6101777.1 histidine kinase [Actinoplanes sandaracinus]
MARWLLPVLLVVGQLLFWPVLPLLRGDPVAAVPAAGVAAACLLIGAGLGWRRERPAPALAAVLAGNGLAALAAPAAPQWMDSHDALLVIWLSLLVGLFNVAVRAPARTTVHAYVAVMLLECVVAAAQHGIGGDHLVTVVLAVAVHGLVAALGRRRGRWNAERAAAARRLVAAHEAGRDATAAERRRLARELHDVTAHHLTSIVVNSSAADMLGDQRPDLRAEALEFAARTGRETLDALRRLVAIMPAAAPPGDEPTLADLAEGFRALGQRITLDLPDGGPPPEAAAVAYGIVREALTNTLRYAPGADVRVRWTSTDVGSFTGGAFSTGHAPSVGRALSGERALSTGHAAELVIEDDGGAAPVVGLGGGRGLAGMRERAESVGGTCEAGPRPGGGWRVRLVLPGAGETVRAAYPWLRSQAVIDAALILVLLVFQFTGIAVALEEGLSPATAALVLIAQIAQAVPLMWRRRAAWWVLAAAILTGGLGPLLVLTGVVPAGLGYLFALSVAVPLAAVYAVAAWGVQPSLTWLAALAVSVPSAIVVSLLIALDVADDPEAAGDGPEALAAMMILLSVVLAIALMVPAGICWAAGYTARRRRDRLREREEGGVAAALAQAAFQARLERLRIASGLHEAVLRHAAAVPAAAERGDLDGVLDAARQALTAMRSLLDGLGSRPEPPGRPPAAPVFAREEVPSSPSV